MNACSAAFLIKLMKLVWHVYGFFFGYLKIKNNQILFQVFNHSACQYNNNLKYYINWACTHLKNSIAYLDPTELDRSIFIKKVTEQLRHMQQLHNTSTPIAPQIIDNTKHKPTFY